MQLAAGHAASLADTATLHAYRAATDLDDAARGGWYPDYDARARMRMDAGADQAVVEKFLAHAKLRQGLAHPHLARRVESGRTAEGLPYFVSEPFNGESLGAFLSRHGPLEPSRAIRLFLPLCDAISYLHHRNLVHGDLKPSNVFLVDGIDAYNPMLFDSGLALFRYRTRCGTVWGHTGSYPGYRLFAAASANGRRSVVFSVNSQIVPGQGSPRVSGLIRKAQADAVCQALR